MDIYKNKYLKYKTKYLELKNQSGGDLSYSESLKRTTILNNFIKLVTIDMEKRGDVVDPYDLSILINDDIYQICNHIDNNTIDEIKIGVLGGGIIKPILVKLPSEIKYIVKTNTTSLRASRALYFHRYFKEYHDKRIEILSKTGNNYDVINNDDKIYLKTIKSYFYKNYTIEMFVENGRYLFEEINKPTFRLNKIGIYEQLLSSMFLLSIEDVSGPYNVLYKEDTNEIYLIDFGEEEEIAFSGEFSMFLIPEEYSRLYNTSTNLYLKTMPMEKCIGNINF